MTSSLDSTCVIPTAWRWTRQFSHKVDVWFAAYVVARGWTRVCPSVAVCVRATVSRVVQKRVCASVCVCALPCACAAAAVVKKSMLCGRKTVNTTFGYGFAHFAFVGGREETGDETLFSLLLSSLSLCSGLRPPPV